MEGKKPEELEGIDNVRQWMREYSPTEWQTPCIDATLTFTWLMNHLGEPRKWWPRMDLDTAPRETILHEAARRMLLKMKNAGFFRSAIENMIGEMTDWQ